MADIVALASALAAAGPWTILVAFVVAVGFVLAKGWYVPSKFWEREAKRADDQSLVIASFTKSPDEITDEIRWRDRGRDAPK